MESWDTFIVLREQVRRKRVADAVIRDLDDMELAAIPIMRQLVDAEPSVIRKLNDAVAALAQAQ